LQRYQRCNPSEVTWITTFSRIRLIETVKNELRKDYLLDTWVVYAPGRAKRPADFVVSPSSAGSKTCYFCPGNENLTPPAKLLYVLDENEILRTRDIGEKRRSDWSVRCRPSLYPAFESTSTAELGKEQGHFPHIKSKAVGVHEIIIKSPNHDGPHKTRSLRKSKL